MEFDLWVKTVVDKDSRAAQAVNLHESTRNLNFNGRRKIYLRLLLLLSRQMTTNFEKNETYHSVLHVIIFANICQHYPGFQIRLN